MNTIILIYALIESRHSTSVAKQFEESYYEGNFADQNKSALRLIKKEIDQVIRANVLSDSSQEEMMQYKGELDTFLNSIKVGEFVPVYKFEFKLQKD